MRYKLGLSDHLRVPFWARSSFMVPLRMPASRASTLLGSTPLTKQAMAEKAVNQEQKFGSLKDMSPEEKEAQLPGTPGHVLTKHDGYV